MIFKSFFLLFKALKKMFTVKYGEDAKTEYEKYEKNTDGPKIVRSSPFKNSKKIITCSILSENGNFLSFGMANLYPLESKRRCDQLNFGENANRELWIDLMFSRNNTGKKLLKQLEKELLLSVDISQLKRKNIYIFSVDEAHGFYHSQGYREIKINSHEGDEDCPDIFMSSTGYKCWMAKPIGDVLASSEWRRLDCEEEYQVKIDEYYIGSCLERGRSDLLNEILSFSVGWKDLQILYDIKKNTSHNALLNSLIKDLSLYFNTGKYDPDIERYFNMEKVSSKMLKEIIDNYMDCFF